MYGDATEPRADASARPPVPNELISELYRAHGLALVRVALLLVGEPMISAASRSRARHWRSASVNLATRQVRSWTLRDRTGSSVLYSVALSADGRQLVFSQGSFPAAGPSTMVARILPTGAPAGSFDQRSTVVSPAAEWAALSADGRVLYTCSKPLLGVLAGGRTTGGVTYSVDSIANGRHQVIASWPPQQYPICGASLDTSGGTC